MRECHHGFGGISLGQLRSILNIYLKMPLARGAVSAEARISQIAERWMNVMLEFSLFGPQQCPQPCAGCKKDFIPVK